jgi:hypothetical protein
MECIRGNQPKKCNTCRDYYRPSYKYPLCNNCHDQRITCERCQIRYEPDDCSDNTEVTFVSLLEIIKIKDDEIITIHNELTELKEAQQDFILDLQFLKDEIKKLKRHHETNNISNP